MTTSTTSSTDLNMETDCTTSIHTTALSPPYDSHLSVRSFCEQAATSNHFARGLLELVRRSAYSPRTSRCTPGTPPATLCAHQPQSLRMYDTSQEKNPYEEVFQKFNQDEKYIIEGKIGKGGFGTVLILFEKTSGLKSALKIQEVKPGDEKPFREAKILEKLSQLDHPCLIRTQEIKFIYSTMFIKMEYMQGGDLSQFVNSSGPHLSKWETKVIFYQIVKAVNYLHTKGICHRDLTPGNILLKSARPDTLIKIADFGLAKLEIIHGPLTSHCGTKQFLAPEVGNKQPPEVYDKKVDVWSMGVILHLSLTGEYPEHVENLRHKILLGEENNEIFTLLQRMLKRNPEHRLTASDVIEQKWLKDKQLEEKVKTLVAHDSSARQKIGPNLAEPLAVGSGVSAMDCTPCSSSKQSLVCVVLQLIFIVMAIVLLWIYPSLKSNGGRFEKVLERSGGTGVWRSCGRSVGVQGGVEFMEWE